MRQRCLYVRVVPLPMRRFESEAGARRTLVLSKVRAVLPKNQAIARVDDVTLSQSVKCRLAAILQKISMQANKQGTTFNFIFTLINYKPL